MNTVAGILIFLVIGIVGACAAGPYCRHKRQQGIVRQAFTKCRICGRF